MTIYKIRHKTTGLFSLGGASPRFSKKGKVWTSMGALNCHLGLVKKYRWNTTYIDNIEIVEYSYEIENTGERVIEVNK